MHLCPAGRRVLQHAGTVPGVCSSASCFLECSFRTSFTETSCAVLVDSLRCGTTDHLFAFSRHSAYNPSLSQKRDVVHKLKAVVVTLHTWSERSVVLFILCCIPEGCVCGVFLFVKLPSPCLFLSDKDSFAVCSRSLIGDADGRGRVCYIFC